MSSERVNAYRARAEECRIAALRSTYPDVRTTYWQLAEQWETMARQIEQIEAEREQPRTP